MRKLIALFLLLLCPLLPAQALTLPYPEDTILSVINLTETQRALADYLYEPIFCGRERIDLPKGTRYDDVQPAMLCLMADYPELFHLGHQYSTHCYADQPEYATALSPQYIMTTEEAATLRAELYVRAYLMADAETDPLALHDALCAMVTYGGDTEKRHTAVGALLEGVATCEGYAHALTLLYRMAGVPCGMVTGYAVGSSGDGGYHAWNIALLECTAFIDATWNDQEASGRNTHWYYGLSTAQMAADHTPDPGLVIPWCAAQDNWHALQGFQAHSVQDVYHALTVFVRTGEAINLRIPDAGLYASLRADLNGFLDAYNQQCPPEDGLWGSYTYAWSDAQQCLLIARPT